MKFPSFSWIYGNKPAPPNTDRDKNPTGDLFRSIVHEVDNRQKQDIQKWRNAVDQAESDTLPDWEELIDLYRQMAEDTHIAAVIEQATEEIQGTGFEFHMNGEIDEELTERIHRTEWFYDSIKYILEAKFYGFSLISISQKIEDENPQPFFYLNKYSVRKYVGAIDTFPRRFVVPQSYGVKKMPGGLVDIYLDQDEYKDGFMLVQDTTLLGAFQSAAPAWIFKKNALIAWAEYQQIMGVPFRVIKTKIHDRDRRDNAKQMIESSGLATGMVIDETDDFSVVSPTSASSAHQVFLEMLNYLDQQFSKLFLGQTMTTDSGSSRSQAEIHADTKAAKFAGYRKFVSTQINQNFIPRLQRLGVLPEGNLTFKFTDIPENRTYTEKVDAIDKLTRAGYTFDTAYLESFLDMEVGEPNRTLPTGSPLAKMKRNG